MKLSRLCGWAMGVGLLGSALAVESSASATDFYIEGQAQGTGSSWRSDKSIEGVLRTGLQFARIFGIEAQGRLGYANVDERMLMAVGIGGRLAIPVAPFTPYLRLSLIHRHEEPIAALHNDVFGGIFGVGDGIRHRLGMETAIGLDYRFYKKKKTEFFAGVEGDFQLFPDHKGPPIYAGGGLALGLHYSL